MTKEELEHKLQTAKFELEHFETEHSDVLNKHQELISEIDRVSYQLNNELWRIGKCYKLEYDEYSVNSNTIMYIRIIDIFANNEYIADVIRDVPEECEEKYFFSSRIKNANMMYAEYRGTNYCKSTEITDEEFEQLWNVEYKHLLLYDKRSDDVVNPKYTELLGKNYGVQKMSQTVKRVEPKSLFN